MSQPWKIKKRAETKDEWWGIQFWIKTSSNKRFSNCQKVSKPWLYIYDNIWLGRLRWPLQLHLEIMAEDCLCTKSLRLTISSTKCCSSILRVITLLMSFCVTLALWLGVCWLIFSNYFAIGLMCCLILVVVPVIAFYTWDMNAQPSHSLNKVLCDLIFGLLYYSLFNGALVGTAFGLNWLFAIEFWALGIFCSILFAIITTWGVFVPCMKRKEPTAAKGVEDLFEYPVFSVPLNSSNNFTVWIDENIRRHSPNIFQRFHPNELQDLPPSYEECVSP